MDRHQTVEGSCRAPCLCDTEPPEVRLKLLFPVLSSLIQTDFYHCNRKCKRLFTSFVLFLGECILPEHFLALCVTHKGLWCCLMVFGSWWNCHNRFEDFADNQPGITLPFHPITHIILLLWHLKCEHNKEYIFEGEEFGLHKLTWANYMWLVQEVTYFHNNNNAFWTGDFQGERAETSSACSWNNSECLDDKVSNATSNSARNKEL